MKGYSQKDLAPTINQEEEDAGEAAEPQGPAPDQEEKNRATDLYVTARTNLNDFFNSDQGLKLLQGTNQAQGNNQISNYTNVQNLSHGSIKSVLQQNPVCTNMDNANGFQGTLAS